MQCYIDDAFRRSLIIGKQATIFLLPNFVNSRHLLKKRASPKHLRFSEADQILLQMVAVCQKHFVSPKSASFQTKTEFHHQFSLLCLVWRAFSLCLSQVTSTTQVKMKMRPAMQPTKRSDQRIKLGDEIWGEP